MILKFEGIDNWSRPIFKDDKNNRYGATCQLFSYGTTGEEVIARLNPHELSYFGKGLGCEPSGTEFDTSNLTLLP